MDGATEKLGGSSFHDRHAAHSNGACNDLFDCRAVEGLHEIVERAQLERLDGGLEVGVLVWQPNTLYLKPLEGWSDRPHRLHWYRAYNEVKHNRAGAFQQASLQNVTLALSSVFLMLSRLRAIVPSDHAHTHDGRIEWVFAGDFFTVRVPLPTAGR